MQNVTLVLPQDDFAALLSAVGRGSAWQSGASSTAPLMQVRGTRRPRVSRPGRDSRAPRHPEARHTSSLAFQARRPLRTATETRATAPALPAAAGHLGLHPGGLPARLARLHLPHQLHRMGRAGLGAAPGPRRRAPPGLVPAARPAAAAAAGAAAGAAAVQRVGVGRRRQRRGAGRGHRRGRGRVAAAGAGGAGRGDGAEAGQGRQVRSRRGGGRWQRRQRPGGRGQGEGGEDDVRPRWKEEARDGACGAFCARACSTRVSASRRGGCAAPCRRRPARARPTAPTGAATRQLLPPPAPSRRATPSTRPSCR